MIVEDEVVKWTKAASQDCSILNLAACGAALHQCSVPECPRQCSMIIKVKRHAVLLAHVAQVPRVCMRGMAGAGRCATWS